MIEKKTYCDIAMINELAVEDKIIPLKPTQISQNAGSF
jgi:hypothetical protein